MQHCRWFKNTFNLPTSNVGNHWKDKFKKIIRVSDNNANDIHRDTITNENTKAQHDPWQVGSIECEESKEAHSYIFIPSTPNVDHHKCQGTSQEMHICINSHYRYIEYSKQEHQEIICRPSAEVTFFQQSAVSYQKVHMK